MEHNDNEFSKFIGTLSTHENTNYSLWKATKKNKEANNTRPGNQKSR